MLRSCLLSPLQTILSGMPKSSVPASRDRGRSRAELEEVPPSLALVLSSSPSPLWRWELCCSPQHRDATGVSELCPPTTSNRGLTGHGPRAAHVAGGETEAQSSHTESHWE